MKIPATINKMKKPVIMKSKDWLVSGRTALFVMTLALCGSILEAVDGPPTLINYQGFLVDSSGNALGSKPDGDKRVSSPANYKVRFQIYDKQSGGEVKWTEDQVVTVDNGYFNIFLGEVISIPFTVFSSTNSDERFVGITVDLTADDLFSNDSEIAPRLRLLSSPYAFLAQRAIEADKITSDGVNVFTVSDDRANLREKTMSIKPEADKNALELHPGSGSVYTGYINLTDTGLDINHNSSNRNLTLGANGTKALTLGKNGDVKILSTLWSNGSTMPHIALDSVGTGDEWTAQGAYVRVGESGNGTDGKAAMNMTYNGGGWGYTGTGAIGAGRGVPSGGYWGYHYNSRKVHTLSEVGIGTDKPQYKLHIISDTSAPPIYIKNRVGNFSFGPEAMGGTYATCAFNTDTQNFYFNKDILVDGDVTSWATSFALRAFGKTGTPIIVNKEGSLTFHDSIVGDLGWAGWGNPIKLGNINSRNTHAAISGPGGLAIGFHGGTRSIYFIDRMEGHYMRTFDEKGGSSKGSDIRLKKDIQQLEGVLDKLEEVRGVRFRYKADKEDKGYNIGVIAQEIGEFFPELVGSFPNTPGQEGEQYQTVNYEDISPILIEGIKELRAEKDSDDAVLRNENENLKAEVENLELRLSKLEQLVSVLGRDQ
jgi:hypothetical protein